ncbi:uncharacterized protein ASCRUDRAFT_83128 [Ascoidea rubescens DSM 1968]|uniref:Uncharacterized protein n=1 Tax=Ascoidea rubescens DSM 1968 TaxID=1344418 RepID=A0A1D2V8B3_9ASCO|nr:hypothetical protein ASCRUDRAFT_83128 [Ascoidea rubescens DSM 1968]ODV57906.1 hypothetical protein ASCRUDRAFT_83128 [Ascoidea rubescens DSM 1968]
MFEKKFENFVTSIPVSVYPLGLWFELKAKEEPQIRINELYSMEGENELYPIFEIAKLKKEEIILDMKQFETK